MGASAAILGLTEKAGSRKDSLNFPFTFVPLGKKKNCSQAQKLEWQQLNRDNFNKKEKKAAGDSLARVDHF